MKPIIIEVQRELPFSAPVIFDVFMPLDLTHIMTGYGPLPAVSGIENQSGAWDSVGEERTIRTADGHRMLEVLTKVERPSGFAYTLSNMTSVLRFLVSQFHGSWSFEPKSSGQAHPITLATWRYEFQVRSRISWPISWIILNVFWRPYMGQAIERAAEMIPRET